MCFISASCDPVRALSALLRLVMGACARAPVCLPFFHPFHISLTVQRHSFSPQDSPSDKMSSWLCFPTAHWLAEHCPPDSNSNSGRQLPILAVRTSVFTILEKVLASNLTFICNPNSLEKHACGNNSSKRYYVASCMFCSKWY